MEKRVLLLLLHKKEETVCTRESYVLCDFCWSLASGVPGLKKHKDYNEQAQDRDLPCPKRRQRQTLKGPVCNVSKGIYWHKTELKIHTQKKIVVFTLANNKHLYLHEKRVPL